jgi:Uma2 family endonuclease
MAAQGKTQYTPAEYLARDRQAAEKREYLYGETFPFTPPNRWDARIQATLMRYVQARLDAGVAGHVDTALRVKSPPQTYLYPVLVVVLGDADFEDDHHDTLLNPTLVVEIISKTRDVYSPTAKAPFYRRIPSLTDLLLITSTECHVQHFTRVAAGQWHVAEYTDPSETLRLDILDCYVPLSSIYDNLTLSL